MFATARIVTVLLAAGLALPAGGHAGGLMLYGGSFCPPHRTHVDEALRAIRYVGADRVIFMPTSPAAVQYAQVMRTGDWQAVPDHRRLAMTWLATRGHPELCVSSYEMARAKESWSSSRTALHFAGTTPGPVWLLLGSDVMEGFMKWENARLLLERVDLLVDEYPPHLLKPLAAYLPADVVARYRQTAPGTWVGPKGRKIVLARLGTAGLSSRAVREAAAAGRPLDGMVPPMVARYIEHYGLFQRPAAAPPTPRRPPAGMAGE